MKICKIESDHNDILRVRFADNAVAVCDPGDVFEYEEHYSFCKTCKTKECENCEPPRATPSNYSKQDPVMDIRLGMFCKVIKKRPTNYNSAMGPDWPEYYDRFLDQPCLVNGYGLDSNIIIVKFPPELHLSLKKSRFPFRADWLEPLSVTEQEKLILTGMFIMDDKGDKSDGTTQSNLQEVLEGDSDKTRNPGS
jgi:hypothetical protein